MTWCWPRLFQHRNTLKSQTICLFMDLRQYTRKTILVHMRSKPHNLLNIVALGIGGAARDLLKRMRANDDIKHLSKQTDGSAHNIPFGQDNSITVAPTTPNKPRSLPKCKPKDSKISNGRYFGKEV